MVYLQSHALAEGLDPSAWRISLQPPLISLDAYDHDRAGAAAQLMATPAVDKLQIAALPDGGAAKWDESMFMEAVFQKYMNEELTPEDVRAIEKMLDFTKRHADDVGWMTNKAGSFSPKFNRLASRSPYALNTKGELTLLFGQLTATVEERHFAAEWRNELEQIFGVSDWPAHFPILKAQQWRDQVDDVLDTIDWRLHP